VDTVLRVERILNKTYPQDKKYELVQHGKKQINDYAAAYSQAYHKMLKGMVARQMRSSVLSVGSFWYSAWVDAGQPDLNKLINQPLSNEQKARLQQEEALYRSGKALVINH
jgi:Zn-finger nucleic acid-binding protein